MSCRPDVSSIAVSREARSVDREREARRFRTSRDKQGWARDVIAIRFRYPGPNSPAKPWRTVNNRPFSCFSDTSCGHRHEQHAGPPQLCTAAAGLRARTNAVMIRPSMCAMVASSDSPASSRHCLASAAR